MPNLCLVHQESTVAKAFYIKAHISQEKKLMGPSEPLPYLTDKFQSPDDYVNSLLNFSTSSEIFQTLCGGVHISDFFTTQKKSLFHKIIPQEWQAWLLTLEPMVLMDFLMRDDLEMITSCSSAPDTLINYVGEIRRHNLCRSMAKERIIKTELPRQLAVGMVPKKIHEVGIFAEYVMQVVNEIENNLNKEVTHFVDLGSGQNYLGRVLASNPYNKQVIAVENRMPNIKAAKNMDVVAHIAKQENIMRNKKLYRLQQGNPKPIGLLNPKENKNILKSMKRGSSDIIVDLRPRQEIDAKYTLQEGKGHIQYLHHKIEDGDLTDIIKQIELTKFKTTAPLNTKDIVSPKWQSKSSNGLMISDSQDLNLMCISLHSCGNLSHHGIRSLLFNDKVQAIAIIGCCYNLLSDRLNHNPLKCPFLCLDQHPVNAPNFLGREAQTGDPHGFPMSERVANYNDNGLRLNITSRMMALQAPSNWTKNLSDSFFTRHFFRALVQRIFMDYGVVQHSNHELNGVPESTEPIIIGTLRKKCYENFRAYVRGAVEKISHGSERCAQISEKLGCLTDEQIDEYAMRYDHLKKELSITWTLMAFSASVVECLIVVDRWLFLKEHPEVVQKCWVEAIFDYRISPRNLVVVGIKR